MKYTVYTSEQTDMYMQAGNIISDCRLKLQGIAPGPALGTPL